MSIVVVAITCLLVGAAIGVIAVALCGPPPRGGERPYDRERDPGP